MKLTKKALFQLLLVIGTMKVGYATHIVGSTLNYEYMGGNNYKITVVLYRDCRTSNPPIPVAAPDQVFVNVRRSDNTIFTLGSSSKTRIILNTGLPPGEPCARPPDVPVCVEEYTYTIESDRFVSGFDYYLFFSLCCRNSTITNLAPEQQTETIYTKIPNRAVTPNLSNAQFSTRPPSYVCGGKPFTVANDYVDEDGDKVTYELYTPNAGNRDQIDRNQYVPTISGGFPNFTQVTYASPYTGQSPMTANEVIETDSGKLSFTANQFGQFVVGIKMKEYRNGIVISETLRDYQFNIVRCPLPDKAVLALNDVCKSLRSTFANSGSFDRQTTFSWNFGDAGKAPADTSNATNPTYTFSRAGNYNITLTLNKGTPCESKAQQSVRIAQMNAAFTSTGDTCVNMPVSFTDQSTSSSNSPITSRAWNFGDGGSSSATNPSYSYPTGGTYTVRYIVTNSIGCKDSVVNVIKVVQAYPDATVGVNDTLCKNNPTSQLNGEVRNAGGGLWAGGGGLFNPGRTNLRARYTPTQAEMDAGFVDLTLRTTNNSKCGSDSAKIKLVFTDPPVITAEISPYSPICANKVQLPLRGAVRPANNGAVNPYGIKWTAGGGQFISSMTPPDTDPFALYIPTATEIAAGRVNLTITSTNNGGCVPVSASTSVAISPAPTIKAGNDTSVCANSSDILLKGAVTGTTKTLWRTSGGDGTFVGGTGNLRTNYRLGTGDKTRGIVIVVLETVVTPNSTVYPDNCNKVADTLFIKVTPSTLVQAGNDVPVCSNNPQAAINASVTSASGAGTGIWTGGQGQYSPSNNALNLTYLPTIAEVAAKSVTLILTSTNNDKCSAVTDTLRVIFTDAPVVNVGPDGNVCKNNPVIRLAGAITGGATTGVWTGGNGVYSPDSANLTAAYTPTAAEINSGSVRLTLSSTNNGLCLSESKQITYTFNDLPRIDAGSPVTSCKNNPVAQLNASIIQGATGVRWSGGGGSFSPNDSTLNARYQATAAEASTGKIILTATSIGNGNCNAVTDTMSIRFIDIPTATPGTAGPVCANNNRVQLNGSTSTGKGSWTSTSGGSFTPNANQLDAVYIPSTIDSAAGSVTLQLTTLDNGLCASVSNALSITITPVPIVNAGPRQTICSNNPNIQLAGNVTGGASTGSWSGGSNIFQGGNSLLNAIYVPSATDLINKKVTLMLTSTGNTGGKCAATSDTVTFYFSPAPVLTLASSIPVCGEITSVPVSATTNGVPTAFQWSTAGTGTFANSSSLITTYTPSLADIDANSVHITLSTTAQGNCLPTTASTDIVFTLKPSVSAGNPRTLCTGDSLVQLAASGSPGAWSSATGGSFIPSVTDQNAKYRPSITDINAGEATLTFISQPIGPCSSATASVKITIVKSPTVDPGPAQTICSDQSVNLNGVAVNAIGVRWTSTGSGRFLPSDTARNVTYQPSSSEASAGTALLTFKSISQLCGSISKTVLIFIKPNYDVSAGGPQTFCSDVKEIQLAGTRSGQFPIKWTKTGATGAFSPNDTTLTAKFIPSTSDLAAGSFTLTLSSNGSACPNKSSSIIITINPSPQIDAGPNVTICNDTSSVALQGTLLNNRATGGFWTTTAGGTFSPNALVSRYVPKSAEKGTFKFYLTSTGNGICNAVKDSMELTIQDKPMLSAASGKICADVDTIYLNAQLTNATSAQWAKVQAAGSIANATSAQAFYLIAPGDRLGGFASFKVKPTGIGVCKAVESTVIFDLTPPITVFAGDNVTYCANTPQIPLTATFTVATAIQWRTLGTGTFTNTTSPSTFYKPSSQDTTNKKVDIVLTAQAIGSCKSKSDTVTVTFTPMPKVTVPSNFDVCADTAFFELTATSSTGMGRWTSDGSNNFSPSVFDSKVKFAPSANDIAKGKVKFTFTSTNNASCAAVTKSFEVTIMPAPVVSAGPDQTICADAASIKLAPLPNTFGGVKWTTTGFGKFQSTNGNSSTTLNDSYLLASLDTTARQVILTITTTNVGKCRPVSDPVVIRITPAPFIDAGPSAQTICGDLTAIALNGKVGNAKGGKWTTTGTGKFAPTDSAKTASYLISVADSAAGKVKIRYTTYGVGTCKVYRDSLNLTITPAPKVAVGSDKTVCADKDTVFVSGTRLVAKGVLWTSSGKGIFSPRADSINTIYHPTAEDRKNGSVKLRMESTGIGSCKKVSDSLLINISPAPTADAGIGTEYCASIPSIDLEGEISVARRAIWTTSGTGSFSDANNLQATYLPSAADKLLKTVTLTLTTVDNGLCNAVNNKVTYSFTPIPEVTIGNDQTICKDAERVSLNGSYKNAQGGFWEAVGVSQPVFTPDNSQSITSYVFSSADTAKSGLTFKYTTYGSGKCTPVSKTMNVKFLPVPVVNAGVDQALCADLQKIQLVGTVRNAGTGIWKSLGTGVLTSSGQGLTASYVPSASDISIGRVTLVLTSQNNNGCKPVTDTMVATIRKAPQIVAIPSASICADTAGVLITPTILDEGSLLWTSTSGSGTFLPNATTKNITFVPSVSQINQGKANLVLTVRGIAACGLSQAVSNTIIDISKAPSLSLSDISTCEGSQTVDLSAVQNNSIATGFQWTALSPNPGTFTNNGQALSVTYNTTAQEQALVNGAVQIAFKSTAQGKCKPYKDTLTIRFVPTPNVSAGTDQKTCTNSDSLRLKASGSAGFWSKIGAGATGVFKPSNTSLNASYFTSPADKANHFVNLVFTSTPGGTCTPKSDTMLVDIKDGPTARPVPTTDTVVCANSGPVAVMANNSLGSNVVWMTDGTGLFADSLSPSTLYTPSAADIASSQILIRLRILDDEGVCIPAFSKFNLNITPAPVVYAGNDMDICANATAIPLAGSVTKASIGDGKWSLVAPASGTFVSTSASTSKKLDDVYQPTSADITSKKIKLLLISDNNGKCNAALDTVVVVFTPAPMVTAGADRFVCGDTSQVPLQGIVTIVGGGQWAHNGQGFFTDTNQVITRYIPSETERSEGAVVKFTLNSEAAGSCLSESASFDLAITPKPALDFGPNVVACGDTAFIGLNAQVANAGGGLWSLVIGSGKFQSNLKDTSSVLTDKYVPSARDIDNGLILLRLSSTKNGQCKAINNVKSVQLTPTPRISAGSDFEVCGNNRLVNLEGRLIRVATGGTWSSSSSGQFLFSPNNIVTSFQPSGADSASQKVSFVLTSTGNGVCKPVRDTLLVKIHPVPTVNAGANIDTCADFESVALNGQVNLALGGFWTSNGTGTFTDPTSVSTVYEPTEDDKTTGLVNLTLTTDGNGNCLAVSKNIQLVITPRPVVSAGNDTSVCSNAAMVYLKGTQNVAVQAVKWSTVGNASFMEPVNQLATSYKPDSIDTNAGAIAFLLETTQQGKCKPVQDVKIVSFQQAPKIVVSAGFPRTVCQSNASLTLDGKALNANRTVWTIVSQPLFIDSQFDDSLALRTDFVPLVMSPMMDTSYVTARLTGSSTVGKCTTISSQDVLMTILPEPVIDLGPVDTIVVCADKDTVHLAATIKIGNTPVPGFWTSTGSGVFEKNAFVNKTVYRLSSADRNRQLLAFVFKSDGYAGCDTVYKTKMLKLIPAVPTADAGPDQAICSNNPVVPLSGRITVASVFDWSNFPTGGSFSPSNDLNTNYLGAPAVVSSGAVKIKLTTHGPGACKDVVDEMLVTFTERPIVNVKADSIDLCSDNDSLQLATDVQHANGIRWVSSGSGQFLPNEVTANAIYKASLADIETGLVKLTLTATDIGNCLPVSDSVIVKIRKAPISVATTKDNANCVSQTGISLQGASSTGAGFWQSSGTGSFSPNINEPNSTYYPGFEDYADGKVNLIFTTLDNMTCKPVSRVVMVNVSPLPVADAGKDQKICIGTTTVISPVTRPNLVSYNWEQLVPTATAIDSTVFNTPVLTTRAVYKLRVVDNKGCDNVDTMEVNVFTKPALDYNSPYCAKDLIAAVTLPYDTLDGAFQWYVDGNILSAETRSAISPAGKGNYKNIFSFYNCQVSDSALVRPIPVLNGVNRILCQNVMNDTIAMNLVPKNNGYTWSVTKINSGIKTPLSETGNRFTHNVGIDTLVYYATVLDSTNICSATDSIVVFPVPAPKYSYLGDTSLCAGNSVILDATPTNFSSSRIQYKWTPNGSQTATYPISIPTNLAQSDTALYTVLFTLGTCTSLDSATVTGNPLPIANLADKHIFCGDLQEPASNRSVTLDAGSNGKFLWSTGDTTRTITTSTEGPYTVVVTNIYQCKTADSTVLIEQCVPRVFIPNAFSPNGDNRNDVFRIFGNKFVKNFKLMVFSRWGEIIFYLEDIDGANIFEVSNKVYSWDGNYKGDQMPIGVYEFIATYEGKDDQYKGPFKQTGSITIIR